MVGLATGSTRSRMTHLRHPTVSVPCADVDVVSRFDPRGIEEDRLPFKSVAQLHKLGCNLPLARLIDQQQGLGNRFLSDRRHVKLQRYACYEAQ